MEKVNSSEADSEADTFSTDALLADLEPLEDLDDAEFGIPPVENPPTLEEILAVGRYGNFKQDFKNKVHFKFWYKLTVKHSNLITTDEKWTLNKPYQSYEKSNPRKQSLK